MTDEEQEDEFSLPKLILSFGRKPTILCVEDNEINAQLIVEILEDYCDIKYTAEGESAIKLAGRYQYDLILMDIGLGNGMNGIEATKAIHKVPGNEDIPVAAVSGYLLSYKKEELSDAGIDYYLAKPFTKKELLNLVQDILIKSIFSAPQSFPDTPIGAP